MYDILTYGLFVVILLLSVSQEKGSNMALARTLNKKVLVLNGNQLCEYIALSVDDEITIEDNRRGDVHNVVIGIGLKSFTKDFTSLRIEAAEVRYVIVDVTQNNIKAQIIGVAEAYDFEEDQPGEVYFLE
jgi:hypothetical protein